MSQYNSNLNNLIIDRNENLNNYSNVNIINNIINNNNNNILFLNQFKSAFSLVELSIVLIIIGLLISAVIGGRALIDEAKVKIAIKEFETILIALQQYESIPEAPENKHLCGSKQYDIRTFTRLKDLGLIDKNKYVQYPNSGNNPSKQGYISKIQANKYGGNRYLVWTNNEGCYTWSSDNKNNKYNKSMKLELMYGWTTATKAGIYSKYGASLDKKLCLKIQDRLRSRYGENVASNTQSNNLFFKCNCFDDKHSSTVDCSSEGITKTGFYVLIYNL